MGIYKYFVFIIMTFSSFSKEIIICGGNWAHPFLMEHFESRGHNVTIANSNFLLKSLLKKNEYDLLLCIEINKYRHKVVNMFGEKNKSALLIVEPPTVRLESHNKNLHEAFSIVLTWNDKLVDNLKYFKIFHPLTLHPPREQIAYSNNVNFHDRKLVTMALSNKNSEYCNELYSERRKVVAFFEDKKEKFEFYGYKWDKQGFRNYKGLKPNKVFENYRFAFAFENTRNIVGYITEKIFDPMLDGCIPIYKGANNIEVFVPKECFISYDDFSNLDDLYNYLNNFQENEYYSKMEGIEKFLNSQEFKNFSIENFKKVICDRLSL